MSNVIYSVKINEWHLALLLIYVWGLPLFKVPFLKNMNSSDKRYFMNWKDQRLWFPVLLMKKLWLRTTKEFTKEFIHKLSIVAPTLEPKKYQLEKNFESHVNLWTALYYKVRIRGVSYYELSSRCRAPVMCICWCHMR